MPGGFAALDTSFPALEGRSAEEQVRVLTDYLYQMLESLRYTLRNLDDENMNASFLKKISGAAGAEIEVELDAIRLRVTTAEGDIATLELTADGLDSRVTAAEGDISTLQQTATSLTSRISSAEGDISTLEQTASGLSSRVTNTEGDVSALEQTVSGITLAVSSATGAGGQTYATITLRVGEDSYTGQILLDGNVSVSGQLSADELYTTYGDMANLSVDRLRTSRRIPLYLAHNTADDNFVDAAAERVRLIAGVYDATGSGSYYDAGGSAVAVTGYTQARNPNNEPLFWESDPGGSGVVIGADGYPYKNGTRIFFTTANSGYPVLVYTYTEKIKAQLAFVLSPQGYYEPKLLLGEGDEHGYGVGTLYKSTDALHLTYTDQNGADVGMIARRSGYLDLYGLRKTTRLDFSGWDGGSFSETVDGGAVNSFSVSFDGAGKPVKITDGAGHETAVIW